MHTLRISDAKLVASLSNSSGVKPKSLIFRSATSQSSCSFTSIVMNTNLFPIVQCVHPVTRADMLYQVYLSVVIGREHQIGTSLIERHRVERGENTYITHSDIFRTGVTIAVNEISNIIFVFPSRRLPAGLDCLLSHLRATLRLQALFL